MCTSAKHLPDFSLGLVKLQVEVFNFSCQWLNTENV